MDPVGEARGAGETADWICRGGGEGSGGSGGAGGGVRGGAGDEGVNGSCRQWCAGGVVELECSFFLRSHVLVRIECVFSDSRT